MGTPRVAWLRGAAGAAGWLKLATRYTTWQALVLALNVVAGFVVVRLLSLEEYARFSIVLAMMTAAVTVADSGICNTLTARAAAASGDRRRLGQLMDAAGRMARGVIPWVIVGFVGVSWWLLADHGSTRFTTIASVLVAAYVVASMARMLWHVLARLQCSAATVLAVDTTVDCVRPVLMVAVVAAWPAALPALVVPVVLAVLHWLTYRGRVAPGLEAGRASPSDRADFRAATLQVLPVAVFFVFQGQVALWVLAAVGTAADVAGLGAIGRFAAVYSLAGPFIANVLSPRIAAIREGEHLRLRVRQIVAGALVVVAMVTALSAALADYALALLGPAYQHLGFEFLAVMALSGLGFVTGVVNAINVSRAWYVHYWLAIPTTLAGQIVVVMLVDTSTLRGSLALSAVSAAGLLLVYAFICAKGVAQFRRETATDRP